MTWQTSSIKASFGLTKSLEISIICKSRIHQKPFCSFRAGQPALSCAASVQTDTAVQLSHRNTSLAICCCTLFLPKGQADPINRGHGAQCLYRPPPAAPKLPRLQSLLQRKLKCAASRQCQRTFHAGISVRPQPGPAPACLQRRRPRSPCRRWRAA